MPFFLIFKVPICEKSIACLQVNIPYEILAHDHGANYNLFLFDQIIAVTKHKVCQFFLSEYVFVCSNFSSFFFDLWTFQLMMIKRQYVHCNECFYAISIVHVWRWSGSKLFYFFGNHHSLIALHCEDFFEGISLEDFFGRNFWEDFFGRIFSGGFLGGFFVRNSLVGI